MAIRNRHSRNLILSFAFTRHRSVNRSRISASLQSHRKERCSWCREAPRCSRHLASIWSDVASCLEVIYYARGARVSTFCSQRIRWFSSSLLLCLSFWLDRAGPLREAHNFKSLVLSFTTMHRLPFPVRYKRRNPSRHSRHCMIISMYVFLAIPGQLHLRGVADWWEKVNLRTGPLSLGHQDRGPVIKLTFPHRPATHWRGNCQIRGSDQATYKRDYLLWGWVRTVLFSSFHFQQNYPVWPLQLTSDCQSVV